MIRQHTILWRVILPVLLLMPLLASAQTKTNFRISGKVTDEAGEPLIGVTVQLIEVRGAGTITDFDGMYELSGSAANGDYTLEMSYVGYGTQRFKVNVGNSPAIEQNATLSGDILNLDEVVVTGASATSTRKQLGNAVNVVDGSQLSKAGTVNALGALSGKVMGAQITQNDGGPGGGISVRLRGPSTINGASQPLFIVDGVIVDNSSQNVINRNADAQATGFQSGQNRIIDINPNDIERIEVINGAAAAAIYGSLASNGVVQIFTKRGKVGKPQINFSTTVSMSQLRKRLPMNMEPVRFGYPGSPRLATAGDRLTTIADLRSAADRAANPGTGPLSLGGTLVEVTYPVTRYDYQDDLFQTAYGTDNYLSISGGTDKTRYYGSLSYGNNEGILKTTNFQRYGARLRIDQTLTDWANMSVGVGYTNSSSRDLPNGNNFFNPISAMVIIDNVWDINERDQEGRLQHVELVRMNPLSTIEGFDIGQETNRMVGDLQFNVYPFKGMSFRYVLGLDAYSLQGHQLQQRVPYPGVAATFFPDGYVSVGTDNVFKTNHDITLSYQFNIGDKISSTTTAGSQYLYDRRNFTFAEGRDLLPFITTIRAAGNFFTPAFESLSETAVWGYFLQQTFGFNDLLFLTLAGRMDGSSVFGENERNQFYPKASASFVLSDLGFWKDGGLGSAINTFKLRASYGQAGNLTGIGAYQRFSNYSSVVITGRSGLQTAVALGNPDIRPERQTEIEVGADMSFFKNRLGLQFTYYTQDITDLLLDRVIASSSGGTSTIANIGEMSNKGLELLLTASPVRKSNFNWDMSVSFSTFENKVSGIGGGRGGIVLRGGGGTQSAIDGQGLGVFNGVYYARNPDGTLLLSPIGLPQVERGSDATGIPARNDQGQPVGDPIRKILGDPNPEWTGTFVNELRYKKFGFRFQFDAIYGFDVWNWNKITSNNVGNGPMAAQELRGELPRGWVAAIGGFIGPRIQEEHVEDGSFIKLREIALTYDAGKVGAFKNLTFSLSGRNILSFDEYSGYDPETNSAGQNDRVRGDDFGNVPIPRTILFGVNASF